MLDDNRKKKIDLHLLGGSVPNLKLQHNIHALRPLRTFYEPGILSTAQMEVMLSNIRPIAFGGFT